MKIENKTPKKADSDIPQVDKKGVGLHGCSAPSEPKIGVDEFLALARRFGFNPDALDRLARAVSNDDLPKGGPNLGKYVTTNPKPSAGSQFEALAREVFAAKYALGLSSGTGSLHAAMVAIGAGPGKEVIIPALGFMATAAAVAMTGATPVFCDVDLSLQIDPDKIEACLSPATIGVAPTHHWGMVADMDAVMAVARKHRLKVVEDCAQSPGARYRGQAVGTIGDMGCFSISAYKIIGGGEGGLLLTDNESLFDRANQLAECGGLWRNHRFAPPRHEGELFPGTNYRMSELEAAIDTVQLGKLEAVVARSRQVRQAIVSRLLSCQEITPQTNNDPTGIIGYQLRFFPESHELGARLVEALRAEGISAYTRGPNGVPDWHVAAEMFPMHGIARGYDQCPVAADLFRREISISLDSSLNGEDCSAFANAFNKVLRTLCTPSADAAPFV